MFNSNQNIDNTLKKWAHPKNREESINQHLDPYLLFIFAVAIHYSVHETKVTAKELKNGLSFKEQEILFEILNRNQSLLFQEDETTPRQISTGIKNQDDLTLLRRAHYVFTQVFQPFGLSVEEVKYILPAIIVEGVKAPSLQDLIFTKAHSDSEFKAALIDAAKTSHLITTKDETSEITAGEKALDDTLLKKFRQLRTLSASIQLTKNSSESFDAFLSVVLKVRQEKDPKKLKQIVVSQGRLEKYNVLGLAAAFATPEIFERIYEIVQGDSGKDTNGDVAGDLKGNSLFCIAVLNQNRVLCDYFFEKLNSQSKIGYIPNVQLVTALLHVAVNKGDVESVNKLIKVGANVNEKTPDGKTMLHAAVKLKRKEIIPILINNKIKINEKDDDGDTALHLAVHSQKSEEFVPILINAGANLDEKNSSGNTALHLAVWYGMKDMVNLMLEWGADRSVMNDAGEMPVQKASGKHEIVDLFFKQTSTDTLKISTPSATAITAVLTQTNTLPSTPANPGRSAQDPMVVAIAAINGFELELLKSLLKKYKIINSAADASGNTLLHLALGLPRRPDDGKDIVKQLIINGADLHKKNGNGRTPLNLIRDHSIGNQELLSAIRRYPPVRRYLSRIQLDSSAFNAFGSTFAPVIIVFLICLILVVLPVGATGGFPLLLTVGLPIMGGLLLTSLLTSLTFNLTPQKYFDAVKNFFTSGFGLLSNNKSPTSPASVPNEKTALLSKSSETSQNPSPEASPKPSLEVEDGRRTYASPATSSSDFSSRILEAFPKSKVRDLSLIPAEELKECLSILSKELEPRKESVHMKELIATVNATLDIIKKQPKSTACDTGLIEVYSLLKTLKEKRFDIMDESRADLEPVALVEAQMTALEKLWDKYHGENL